MSRSSAWSSLLPRAWSAMVLPGHFSNRSIRSTRSQQRPEDADGAERGTGGDADVRLVGDVAEPLVVDDGLDGALPRVVRDAVARQVLVRTRGTVPGDRAHHDLRVELLEPLVAEAHLGE